MLLFLRGAGGKTMREIGASKRAAARAVVVHCLDAGKIFFPRGLAAPANAGRHIGDCCLNHPWLLNAAKRPGAPCTTSNGVFAPAAPIALDKRDRGGWAPGAREIGTRRLVHLVPGLPDRIDPAPSRLDLVAA